MRQPREIYNTGTRVRKLSGKPFKSRSLINTIETVTEHPYKINPITNTGVTAYTFLEDESVVEAAAVIKIE